MIIALAGRRTDAANAPVARFPLEKSATVRERLLTTFKEQRATDLVASASCGADLLALAAAAELGMRCHIVLPFSPDEFRALSVVDRPGDWGNVFDQFIREVEAMGQLLLLGADSSTNAEALEEIFILTNRVILEKAQQLAGGTGDPRPAQDDVLAVIVWEGQSRGNGDLTANFAVLAHDMAIPIIEVGTH
jgi:hypothetical protein